MAHLQKRWKKELPSIQQISEARGHLSKAHTFHAGAISNTGAHVFLNFQHSNKAWEVGRFTINVVLSADEQNPKMYPGTKSDAGFGDGYYRIGHLIGRKDKWWHLQQDDDPILTEAWRPSNYENLDLVLSEAVDDVTRDVLSAMKLLGVPIESQQTP